MEKHFFNNYFGRPKTLESSCIWASLMPSGSKPIPRAAMYITGTFEQYRISGSENHIGIISLS